MRRRCSARTRSSSTPMTRGHIVAGTTLGVLLLLAGRPTLAQRARTFMGSLDDPAIRYATMPLRNSVVDVNRELQEGTTSLAFEGRSGFLRSALDALKIPVDSQLLVFSRASLQGRRINE